MSWRKHFSPINNSGLPMGPQRVDDGGSYGTSHSRYSSWLPEVYAGSPNRLQRYIQYDSMDNDHSVCIALDTIAEFGTQEDEYNGLPFDIDYIEDPSETESKILQKALYQWCNINEMYKRLFRIFRSTCKYGDQLFIRDPETYKLHWIDPANVEKVLVNEAGGKQIEAYFIKDLDPNFGELTATGVAALHNRPYGSGQGYTGVIGSVNPTASNFLTGNLNGVDQGVPVESKHIVHISLSEGMDMAWPFGVSILEPVFKVFKQKELLEDSIIIYRVHRAPERRVFFIDVGNMPPHKAQQYLEQVKYEVQQKRMPSVDSEGNSIGDAAYNPMSMLEDYFFAQTADGRGSKVDTLAGGENLGQIDDLRYFKNELMRGLRVPSSYLPSGPDDSSAQYGDGKVGIAYIQEYRFSKFVERLQRQIIDPLDREFKMFLKHRGIDIDSGNFYLKFTEPMNFSAYRDLQLDSERANLFGSLEGAAYLSKQFLLRRYLGLTDDEIRENEEYWREENADTSAAEGSLGKGELRGMGVTPQADEEVDPDAEPDIDEFDLGDEELGGEEFGGDEVNTGGAGGEPGGT